MTNFYAKRFLVEANYWGCLLMCKICHLHIVQIVLISSLFINWWVFTFKNFPTNIVHFFSLLLTCFMTYYVIPLLSFFAPLGFAISNQILRQMGQFCFEFFVSPKLISSSALSLAPKKLVRILAKKLPKCEIKPAKKLLFKIDKKFLVENCLSL